MNQGLTKDDWKAFIDLIAKSNSVQKTMMITMLEDARQ